MACAVSAEIRAELARLRMTATEMGIQSGISQNYISKRLRDEAPFTVNDLEKIGPVLGRTALGILTDSARRLEERMNEHVKPPRKGRGR